MRLLAHHNCGDRAESLFLCGEARKRGFFYGSGFDREQLVVGAGAVYGGAGLHHQGRRFLCGRRSLDGRKPPESPSLSSGCTVVSFATTLPEMLVSVFAALEGNADIAVGNAVGRLRPTRD